MPVKVRIVNQQFGVAVKAALSATEQKKAVADFARQSLADAQQQNRSALGYLPAHTVTVDGREGARLETVKLAGGLIRFDFDIWSASVKVIIETALKMLRAASPVVSGRYRDAHTLYVGGVPRDDVPGDLKPQDQIMIANLVPYARRIEVGVTKSGRAFVVQVQPHIYRRVAADLAARFGNQAKIELSSVELPDAGTVSGRLAARSPRYQHAGRLVKRRSHAGEKVLSPALVIKRLQ